MGSAPPIRSSMLRSAVALVPAGTDLVVYVLNVGDGDAIVIQFPEVAGRRAIAVVDSNSGPKSVTLLRELGATQLRFVAATHPHIDHIRGLEQILKTFEVEEFWDSGFRYTSKTYNSIIRQVELQAMRFICVTSGFETFINGVRVTALSPSIVLRNRYDTYGVDPNNASIVLRLEYPVTSPSQSYPAGESAALAAQEARSRTIILGGDAQTDAWSRVVEEFPHLDKDQSNWARQIVVRQGRQPLFCDVLKVSHHCSKHGINLELVERMGDSSGTGPSEGPQYLISSCSQGPDSTHGFPHAVTQAILREVRNPHAKSGGSHNPDDDDKLGIHYTAQMIEATGQPAGSIAVVLSEAGDPPVLYRLCDGVGPGTTPSLASARKVV